MEIVEKAGAADYLPTFARHRISIETLCQMDERDFEQMGIHEKGLRKALLTEIARYTERQDEERAAAKKKLLEEPEVRSIFSFIPDTSEVIGNSSIPYSVLHTMLCCICNCNRLLKSK